VITFSLQQETEIVTATTYRVTNQILEAQGASPAVYVYKTLTQGFSHYASASDMEQYPDTLEVATLTAAAYYRLPRVVRTWDSVLMMNQDLASAIQRLQFLADELNVRQGTVIVNRTTIVRSA
jgi:hypothetical protein